MVRELLTFGAWALAALVPGVATVALVSAVRAGPTLEAEAAVAPAPQPKPAARPTPVAKPAASPAPVPKPAPAEEPFTIKRILANGAPIRYGDYLWDDAGVPDGPLVITVDLQAETLSVFRGGYEIGATAILYGDDAKPTPLGTFPITEKDADHVSNLYHVPMPYMLRLTNDGISIHGSEVEWGYATHGCIGVPTRFAKLLFGVVKLGDKVIVTRGKRIGVGDAIVRP